MRVVHLARIVTVDGIATEIHPMTTPSALPSAGLSSPLDLPSPLRVSSPYGPRVDPITGKSAFHAGIDFPAPIGTPVLAVEAGVVHKVDKVDDDPNGVFVRVKTSTGRLWYYLHLSEVRVEVGQEIAAGSALGLSGATGRVTGPHLHLQGYTLDEHGWVQETFDPTPLFAPGVFA